MPKNGDEGGGGGAVAAAVGVVLLRLRCAVERWLHRSTGRSTAGRFGRFDRCLATRLDEVDGRRDGSGGGGAQATGDSKPSDQRGAERYILTNPSGD